MAKFGYAGRRYDTEKMVNLGISAPEENGISIRGVFMMPRSQRVFVQTHSVWARVPQSSQITDTRFHEADSGEIQALAQRFKNDQLLDALEPAADVAPMRLTAACASPIDLVRATEGLAPNDVITIRTAGGLSYELMRDREDSRQIIMRLPIADAPFSWERAAGLAADFLGACAASHCEPLTPEPMDVLLFTLRTGGRGNLWAKLPK